MFSPLTKQLIDALRNLPGVGPKSAQRMAFHLLAKNGNPQGLQLAHALQEAMHKVQPCSLCRLYTENVFCDLCSNPKRNAHLLCVVESPADVVAIEQAHYFQGRYFVLHGHLSPLDGVGPDDIGIPLLQKRLTEEPIEEIIIATNATMEGEATAHYIAQHIDRTRVKCTRIAHGVPLGGELEYLDGITLSHAFSSRLPLDS